MKDSIRQRLEKLYDRFEEVGRLLASPEPRGPGDAHALIVTTRADGV